MSERCQNCGELYETVYKVSDTVWATVIKKIGLRRANGLLCPRCVDQIAREKGIILYWAAAINQYPIQPPNKGGSVNNKTELAKFRDEDLTTLIVNVLTELRCIKTNLHQIGIYLRPQIEMRTEIGELNAEVVRAIRREIADQEAEELERQHIASQEAACGDTDKE